MPAKRTYADHGDACAAAHAMELIGDRWTHPILRELMLAPKRFGELEDSVRGITPAVLSARLRELEASGLVRRITLPAPARVGAYDLTDWARGLRPIFSDLARWAHGSPTWSPMGNGLTPDAAVESMLTMAPTGPMSPPLTMALHLHDARLAEDEGYRYLLHWDDRLRIDRDEAPRAATAVTGDSTALIGVLYQGASLTTIRIDGDPAPVHRLIAAYAEVFSNRADD